MKCYVLEDRQCSLRAFSYAVPKKKPGDYDNMYSNDDDTTVTVVGQLLRYVIYGGVETQPDGREAKRVILVINCAGLDIAFSIGGFQRLMDIYRAQVSKLNPWRVFVSGRTTDDTPYMFFEIGFARLGDEYIIQSREFTSFRSMQELIQVALNV